MSKMGLHYPFGYLKHKLWPKEGLGVKLSFWFPTTKSWESPRFTCVQKMCHIPLENYRRGLQFCFRPHFNWRSTRKITDLQSRGNPNLGNFEIPNLWVPRQNDIWVQASWLGTKSTIKGKVVASPKFGPWWVLWVHVCLWFVCAPKVLQLCINQLVVWFVWFVWIIDPLVTHLTPHFEAPTYPLPPKCCESGNVTQLLILPLFSPFDSKLSISRNLGVHQIWC
jgi:hypothetical protein